MTGYEIKKVVDTRFSYFWSESYGQIYPELNSMEKDGVIRESSNQEVLGRRNTRKFEITQSGLHELKDWLSCSVEKEVVRYELLLKLYFSHHTTTETMMDHIREFQINHKKQQLIFEKFQKELEENVDMHDNHREILMVLLFGQKVWKAYDEWCQEILDILSKGKRLREE
jgi:DNA-binding PadR family transcriptional regulator